MQTITRSPLGSAALLLLISLGTLFFRLGSLPLSGNDEPRYARIAEEMYEHGRWITPMLEGRPWLEKPPLYYWLTVPFLSLFGANEITARIGPAFCALITALVVLWLGWRLWTPAAGLIGGSILLTSLGFAGYGRSVSTDMPLTACLTASLAILAAAAVGRHIATWKVMAAYVFLGLAVLAKGPVAVALAGGIGFFFWCLDERGVSLRRWHVVPGLMLTAAVSIPWYWLAFRQNGFAFISTFFINQNIARYVTNIHHHSQPLYYYLPVLIALLFPWSGWLILLVPKSVAGEFRRWRQWNPSALFLACWFLFPMLFFSLSDSKLAGYILPALPPLALLLGVRLSAWIGNESGRSRLRAAMWVYLMLSLAMAAGAPIFFWKDYGGNWKTGLLLSVTILGPSLFAFGYGIRSNWTRAFRATLLQGFLLVLSIAQFAYPVIGVYLSSRDVARQALELRQDGEPIVTYRYFNHSLNYYAGYQIADGLQDPESMNRFARGHPCFLVVTEAKHLPSLLSLQGLPVSLLGEQGKLRLLRVNRR